MGDSASGPGGEGILPRAGTRLLRARRAIILTPAPVKSHNTGCARAGGVVELYHGQMREARMRLSEAIEEIASGRMARAG